jgi:hypothetical protein
VALHYFFAENQFIFPSLRNPFLKLFVEARTTAGATFLPLSIYTAAVFTLMVATRVLLPLEQQAWML